MESDLFGFEKVDHKLVGIQPSKIHPKYLNSNSTSHVWAFGAFAEIIDNAYDPDVGATHISIDKEIIHEESCLVFLDDGAGMNREKLVKMLSFGYCDKEMYINPIGLYGNGFKSGSMRLGKDVIVFTKRREYACVGLLSQSYLEDIKADSIVVPILEYSVSTNILFFSKDVTLNNLDAILRYSPYKTEAELKEQLNSLTENTGTKIVIYNLNRLQDGREELDFKSDPDDILCPESFIKDSSDTQHRPVESLPKYKRSLRAYCSILYLYPKMKITVCGKIVKSKFIQRTLFKTQRLTYKPAWFKTDEKPIKITLGFSCEQDSEKNYGFMLYYKNRLIKAYEKVGYQNQANEKGVGITGIAELNCLTPTHNKQDFKIDQHFNNMKNALSTKLNSYWNEQTESNTIANENKLPDWTWVQCDRCRKWRRLTTGTNPDSLPDLWYCSMNDDAYYNRCYEEEEPDHEEANNSKRRKSGNGENTERKSRKRNKTPIKTAENIPPKNMKIIRNNKTTESAEKLKTQTRSCSDSDDDVDDNPKNLPPKKTIRRNLKRSQTPEKNFNRSQSDSHNLNTDSPERGSKHSKDMNENNVNGLNGLLLTKSKKPRPGCSKWPDSIEMDNFEDRSDIEETAAACDDEAYSVGSSDLEETPASSSQARLVPGNICTLKEAKQDKSVQTEVLYDKDGLTPFHHKVYLLLGLMSQEDTKFGEVADIENMVTSLIDLYI
ncbi:MORC CW-type zinc finger protein 3 [Bulinus truncatus]|nr:MORC CW-type zinc finger protein 3 [Bulinus truncatus]